MDEFMMGSMCRSLAHLPTISLACSLAPSHAHSQSLALLAHSIAHSLIRSLIRMKLVKMKGKDEEHNQINA